MTAQGAEYLVWDAWAASWVAAALWARRATGRPSWRAQAPNLIVSAVGFIILFTMQPFRTDPSPQRLWLAPEWVCWVAVGFSILGFAFCWWARVTLGALWSGTVTVKRDHKVIENGPYRWVRHPIYTGILAALAGQAVIVGTASGLLGFALTVLGFVMKATLEEGFLKKALGAEAYESYAARTPMLAPRPWGKPR